MKTIKSIKINTRMNDKPEEKLTSAEMGKLWAIYMGNTMSKVFLAIISSTWKTKKLKIF